MWGGRRRSGGRLCFQSWLSRAGAREHTVPIRSPVLCCMCFHGFEGVSGERRFLSVLQQPEPNQGDPSQVLACIVGHSCTPCPLTLSLSLCFLNRSEVVNEPWVPMVGVGGWGESWPCLQSTCLMEEVRAGPGDQSLLGSWSEHGSVAWVDGGEDRAVQAAVVPRKVDASGISEKSRLV